MKKITNALLIFSLFVGFVFAPTIYGQVSFEEEVKVTARKREENSQKVPIMLSAVSGTFLEDNAMQDFTQIEATAPSLL